MNTQSITHSKDSSKSRFVLIDLIRIISILPIVPFHLSEFGDGLYQSSLLDSHLNHFLTYGFGQYIPFSGHTVVMLSFFLLGYGLLNRKKAFNVLAGCLIGYVVLYFSYFDGPSNIFYWDVYTFLMSSVLLSLIFLRLPMGWLWALVLGMATSSPGIIHLNYEFLGGICNQEVQSSWPLMPWGFYAAFMCCLGQKIKTGKSQSLINLQMQMVKYSKWLIGLFILVAPFGLADVLKADPDAHLYCLFQSFSFFEKYYLIAMLTFIFIYSIQENTNTLWNRTWLRHLGKSAWNKNFFLAYLLQLVLIGIATSYGDVFLNTPLKYDITLAGIFLSVELITHIYIYLQKFISKSR
jgi:hypothetical protein